MVDGQISAILRFTAWDSAQAFTTSGNGDSYTATSVDSTLRYGGNDHTPFLSTTYSSAQNEPDSVVGTLTNPASLAADINTFEITGIDLHRNVQIKED